MRKKLFALFLCITSVFAFAGCASVEVKDDNVKVDVGNIHVDVDEDKNGDDVKVDAGNLHIDVDEEDDDVEVKID